MQTYQKIQIFLKDSLPPDSLSAAIQRFLIDKEPDLSRAGLIHIYRTLNHHTSALNNPPLTDITAGLLAGYVDNLRTAYSPGTIRPMVGDLKQFYGWAYDAELTNNNCGRRLKKPRPVKRKHHAVESDIMSLIKFLSQLLEGKLYRDLFGGLQISEKLDYESYKALHDLTVILFLYETGCRAGELCNLSTQHLEKAIREKKPVYGITCYGKTDDSNYRFTNATADLCRLWIESRPFKSTFVFCGWRRGNKPSMITVNALGQMLARRCGQAAISPFRPHSIRHSKVIRSRKIVGLDMASRLIDHSSIESTRGYDYIDEDELNAAAALTGLLEKLW